MEENMREKIEEIKEKVKSRSLYIARVPEKAKKYFMDLADSDFESDYGMTLKYLIDLHKGCFPTGHEMMEGEIEALKIKVEKLESQKEESNQEIKMISGKTIKLKRREKNGNI